MSRCVRVPYERELLLRQCAAYMPVAADSNILRISIPTTEVRFVFVIEWSEA